ncbi:AcrR family transcriptional regulator [Catenulispora sp. GAS73]|uniref:TetR/AcrR family transcriptional regulator n=1 Tax=Catenulispora sp. GAS73 TaxID=3156269 RepID=UPI003511772B
MEPQQLGAPQRRILLAAARVLADDPAASMQQVADEAQVARPTVYGCYPTKVALVEAIGHEAAKEFAAALGHARAAGDGAAATLARLIRELARIGADYPIVLQTPHTEDVDDLVARVDELIEDGQAAGELRGDVASDVLRHALFGALSAGLRLARDPERPQVDSDTVGTQIAAIVVEGMRAGTREKGAPA